LTPEGTTPVAAPFSWLERVDNRDWEPELLEQKDTPRDTLCSALGPTDAERARALGIVDGQLYENAKVRGYVQLRIDGLLSGAKAPDARDNPTVEHVLPQTPEGKSEWLKWWPDEAARSAWTHSLRRRQHAHQGTVPASSKNPAVGPSSGSVARRTMISAPCWTLRMPRCWLRSVAT
jgi:hypothetical protein